MVNKHLYHRKMIATGAALVEFALIAPIFLLMIFALIEFGGVLHYKQIISYASREGARLLAQQGSSINQAEKLVLKNLANSGLNSSEVILSGYDSDPTCRAKNSIVSMEIKIPFNDVSLTGDPLNFFGSTKYLQSKVIMQKECISK